MIGKRLLKLEKRVSLNATRDKCAPFNAFKIDSHLLVPVPMPIFVLGFMNIFLWVRIHLLIHFEVLFFPLYSNAIHIINPGKSTVQEKVNNPTHHNSNARKTANAL